jgi:adenine-specific DNA-methyltransferase
MTDLMPEKIDLTSMRMSSEKLDQLREIVPEAFTEGKIDFDALRRSLGDAVETAPRDERFGLRWPGKSQLQQVINQPSVGTLVPQQDESVNWDTTENIIIEGDNLEVLKLLQKSYAGKAKMIYIDPPYNTGNDFVYPDNHVEGLQSYLEFSGQADSSGRKLQSNTESEGRYHANWLNMMYPRMYLARNLLRQDGVIMVSIDDWEVNHLRSLLNDIFGEENFVDTIIWKKRYGGGAKEKHLVSLHEYTLFFARNKNALKEIYIPLTNETVARYYKSRDSQFEKRGPYRTHPLEATKSMDARPNLVFPILSPDGTEIWPKRQWLWGRDRVSEALENGELEFIRSRDGDWSVHTKQYLIESSGEQRQGKATSIIDDVYTQHGTNEMIELFGDAKVFPFPKPSGFLQKLVQISTHPEENHLVLDFFAGSGTTGHAVMKQNADDKGNRKFILVQLPEPMEESKLLDDGTFCGTIAAICRERVQRAGSKIAAEHGGLNIDTGFRSYKLAESNFRPWDGRVPPMMTSARQASFMPQSLQLSIEDRLLQASNHIQPDATDNTLLVELLLKLGFKLTVPVSKEIMVAKTIYNVDDGLVLICLDRSITLDVIGAMAKRMPAEIICLDAGFSNDRTKVNAGQIIASQARDEETSIAFKVV